MDHLILKFHQSGYKMIDILATLAFNYGYDISLSTLKRRFKKLNLKRYNCESPLTEIVSKIQDEVQTSGQLLGYRALWLRLNVNYGLRSTQQTVAKTLKLIHPKIFTNNCISSSDYLNTNKVSKMNQKFDIFVTLILRIQ
jgi:hypothetical protein